MIGQKNVTHLIVGKDLAILSSGTRASLATGQIGVFKNGSQTPTTSALSAGDLFTIAYKDVSGQVINTPHIEYSNIIRKGSTAYTAAAQKKVFVGYNGTTGSINVGNSDAYLLSVILNDTTTAFQEHPPYEYAEYTSDASATEKEIAEGILASALKNMTNVVKTNKKVMVQPGIVCSATGTDTSGGAFTVVNGSSVVTTVESAASAADAGKYNTDGSTIAAGDYLRFSAATEVKTDEVYKVVSITGGGTGAATIVLDRPFLGTSGSKAANTVSVIPAATAANVATNWGISLTGVAQEFKAGLLKYQVIDFEVVLNSSAFGSTLITVNTARNKGVGTYEEIAEMESFLRGNRGEVFRVASYPVTKTLNAVSGKTYDVIVFDFFDDSVTGIDREIKHYGTIMLATEDESSYTANTTLKTILGIS